MHAAPAEPNGAATPAARRGDLPLRGSRDFRGLDLAPLAFFALFLWLGYSFIGPPLEHPWYLIPATYAVLLVALDTWARLLGRLPALAPPRLRHLRRGRRRRWSCLGRSSQEAAAMASARGSDRIEAYADMARWIRHHGFGGTTVLTYEPGYLTYQSGQRAIDAAGLVTPDVFYHGPQGRRSDLYELLERTRPEMAVLGSPVMHEPLIRQQRYLLALAAAPSRNLWIRRDFYQQHLDALYDAWQRHDYDPGRSAELHHPLQIDFGDGTIGRLSGSATAGSARCPASSSKAGRCRRSSRCSPRTAGSGPPPPGALPSPSTSTASISCSPATRTSSPPPSSTSTGCSPTKWPATTSRAAPAPARRSSGSKFRSTPGVGRQASLFFVSAEGDKGFFAADRVESKIYPRSRMIDDFESGAYDPAIWETFFGVAPVDNKRVAAIGSLVLVQGRFAATSLFAAGAQEMASRPFRVDHRQLELHRIRLRRWPHPDRAAGRWPAPAFLRRPWPPPGRPRHLGPLRPAGPGCGAGRARRRPRGGERHRHRLDPPP